MTTLSVYFPFSLLARPYRLLRYFVFQYKWLAQSNLKNARSSGSSESQHLCLSSSDSYLCVESRLMCGWAPPPPQTGPTGSILYSDLTLPQHQCSRANCKFFLAQRQHPKMRLKEFCIPSSCPTPLPTSFCLTLDSQVLKLLLETIQQ